MEKLEKVNNFLLKNIVLLIVLLVVLYLFIGNKNNNNIDANYANNSQDFVAAPQLMAANAGDGMAKSYNSTSKIIKSYSLTIEVNDSNDIYLKVENKINNLNASIVRFNSYNYFENELAYDFTIKVPTNEIENAINYFKTLGIVKNESSNAIDVGNEYDDNENRLKNLYTRRDRLRKMMNEKTDKLADVLAVDRELTNVQNEIERLEKNNKNIDKNVDYSSLELSILPKIKINSLNNSNWQVSNSWNNAVNDFILFGQKSIDFLFKIITFLPVIMVLVILGLLIKKIFLKKE